MTTVTIHDEATREVLVRAAWIVAVDALGNNEDYVTWLDESDDALRESREVVEGRVATYSQAAALVREIEAAPLGARVEISHEVEDQIEARYQAVGAGDSDWLSGPKAERDRIMRLYDAAERLRPTAVS